MSTPRGTIVYGTPQTAANVTGSGTVAWSNPGNAVGATFNGSNSAHYATAAFTTIAETNGLALTNIDWDREFEEDPVALGFQLSMEGSVTYPSQVSAVEAVMRLAGGTIGNSLHGTAPWSNQRVSARTARGPIGPIFEGTPAEWGYSGLTKEEVETSTFGLMARFGFSVDEALTLRAYGARVWGIFQGEPDIRIASMHTGVQGEQTINIESPGAFHFHCWDSVWGQNFPKDALAEVEVIEAPEGWGYSYADPRQMAAVVGTTHDCRRYRWAKYHALWFGPGTVGTCKVRFRVTLPFPTRQVIESPVITLNITEAAGLQKRWVANNIDEGGGGDSNGTSPETPYAIEDAITEIEANPSTKFLVYLKKGETHTPLTTATLTNAAARTALLCFSSYGTGTRPIWAAASNSVKTIDLINCSNIHFEGINFPGAASTVFTIGVANVSDLTIFDCVLGDNSGLEFTATGTNARHLIVNTSHNFRRYAYFNEGANGYGACIIGCTCTETSDSTGTGEGGLRFSATIASNGDNTHGRYWHVGYSSHRTRAAAGKKFLRPGWGRGDAVGCYCDVFGFAETGDAGYMSAQYENAFHGFETPGSTLQGCKPEEGAIGMAVCNCVIRQEQDTDGWSIAGQIWNRHTFRGNIIFGKNTASDGIFGTVDAVSSQFPYTSVIANLEFINNVMVVDRTGAFSGSYWRSNLVHAIFGDGTNNFQNNIYCGSTSFGFREANNALNISGWNALNSTSGEELINIPPSEFTAAGNYLPNSSTYSGYYNQAPDAGNIGDIRGLYRDVGAGSWPAGPVGLETNPSTPDFTIEAGETTATLTITGDTDEYIVYLGTEPGEYTHWFTGFASGEILSGLEVGVTYYVTVAARDSLGNISDLAEESSFTTAESPAGGGSANPSSTYQPIWPVRGSIVSGGWAGAQWLPWTGLNLAADVDQAAVVEGLVVHVNDDGYMALGPGTTGSASASMTYIVCSNGYDYDAVGPEGNIVGVRVSETGDIAYVPLLVALPTSYPVEVESTNYAAELTYLPGALLTADANGRLTLLSEAVAPSTVVGVVTRAPYDREDGQTVLSFTTVFMPNRQA